MDAVPIYFTYPQPTAYLAWHVITAKPDQFSRIRFTWTPVLYRRLMELQGADARGSPPLLLKYNYADAARQAKAFGIPFSAPHRNAPLDQTAHKVHLLAQDAGCDWETRWLKEMHHAVRRDGMDPTDSAAVRELAKALAIPGLDHLEAAGLDQRLEANTQQAHKDEACGVPFVRWNGEGFLGVEGIEWLAARLAGQSTPVRL